ncbi:hypothetical protein LXL04_026022 [Taraxacum kok-saghyz]
MFFHTAKIKCKFLQSNLDGLAMISTLSKKFLTMHYAFSHNVPQVTITCDDHESIVKFPLSLFTSPSLKHLTLSGPLSASSSFILRPTLDLPSLTTLHLDHITMSNNHNDLFSMCTNLKNLSLKGCKLMRTNVLRICHTRLSNLTIQHTYWWMEAINVVAPQLKNLTIINCYGKHLISTPGLTSLVMKGDHPFRIYTKGFRSLEKADDCIFDPILEDVYEIVSLFQQLHSVKFLTLNVEILKLLSSSMGLIDSHQLFPFANFKILKFSIIHPIRVYLEVRAKEEVTTFTEIKNDQVLDSSSTSSIFTIVSFEEINILRDIVLAEKLIAELRMGIEQCETHEQRKIERLLMTKLQQIKGRVTELPASKRLAVQATFSVVCEEAETVTNNMLDCMGIRYNKKLKRSNV